MRTYYIGCLALALALLLIELAEPASPPELTGYYRAGSQPGACGTEVRSYVHSTERIIQRRWFVSGRAIVAQAIIQRGKLAYYHLWVSRLGAGYWEKVQEAQNVCELVTWAGEYDVL